MYTFIEYPKCSTCRKAKSELDGLQCEFQSQNIVTETPTSQELQEWMTASGLPKTIRRLRFVREKGVGLPFHFAVKMI